MPFWIYAVIASDVAVLAVAVLVYRRAQRKLERYFTEAGTRNPLVYSRCMLRVGFIECPGVAYIADERLFLEPLVGKRREIPLASITVESESFGFGKLGWLGKRVLRLHVPSTPRIALGVSDPAPWRRALGAGMAARPRRAGA